MKNLTALLKPLAMSVALLAIFGAGHIAKADPVTVSGSSTGTVTGSVAPFLTFTGNTFTATTAGGVGSFSGNDRIGTFTLASRAANEAPVSGNFTLNITFTAPSGIQGGQSTTFTSTVSGTVSTPNVGGLRITFDTPMRTFLFSNASGSGSFTLELPTIFVQSGETANLTAGLTGNQTSAVPEPATMLLLGTGLAGIAAKVRKRRTANQD